MKPLLILRDVQLYRHGLLFTKTSPSYSLYYLKIFVIQSQYVAILEITLVYSRNRGVIEHNALAVGKLCGPSQAMVTCQNHSSLFGFDQHYIHCRQGVVIVNDQESYRALLLQFLYEGQIEVMPLSPCFVRQLPSIATYIYISRWLAAGRSSPHTSVRQTVQFGYLSFHLFTLCQFHNAMPKLKARPVNLTNSGAICHSKSSKHITQLSAITP